jgi:hypothetical protein
VKLTTHLHVMPRSRMRGAIPPLPQYVFMAWCLVKHSDNFTSLPFYVIIIQLEETANIKSLGNEAVLPTLKQCSWTVVSFCSFVLYSTKYLIKVRFKFF